MKIDKEKFEILLEEVRTYSDNNCYYLAGIINNLHCKGVFTDMQEYFMNLILKRDIIRDNFTGLDFSWEKHSKEEIVNYLLNLLKNYENK